MRIVVSILSVLLSCMALAQTPPSLSLDDCIALALENNGRVQAAVRQLRTAELARTEISTTALPQLGYAVGGSYAPATGHFGYDPIISNQGQVSGQVIMQQSVYDAGVRGIRSGQLDLDIQRSTAEAGIVRRDLVFAVTQAFVDATRAREEASLGRESIAQLAEYLDIVRQVSTRGGASYTDVLKTEIQLSNAQLVVQKAGDAESSSKLLLAEMIGRAVDTSFSLSGSLDSLLAPAGETAFHQNDLTLNLDYRLALMNMQTGVLEVDLASRERAPSVSLFADAGLLTSIENLKLPASERGGMVGYSLGINITGLLYNWGGTDLRVQQREAQVEFLRLQTQTLQRSLTSEFTRTQFQLANARDRLRLLRSNIGRARDNYLLTKSKFVGGGTSSLEVLNAQQLLTDAELNAVGALADIQTLTAKLQQLTAQ